MMRTTSAILILLVSQVLLLIACKKQTLQSGVIHFSHDEMGVSFKSDTVFWLHGDKKWDLADQCDFVWSDGGFATLKKTVAHPVDDFDLYEDRLAHLGKVNFDSIKSVDTDDWRAIYGSGAYGMKNVGREDFVDHVFIVKTHFNTYVKLIVTDVELDSDYDVRSQITFTYLHQLNGTREF